MQALELLGVLRSTPSPHVPCAHEEEWGMEADGPVCAFRLCPFSHRAFGKSPNLSEPQLPSLYNGHNNVICF